MSQEKQHRGRFVEPNAIHQKIMWLVLFSIVCHLNITLLTRFFWTVSLKKQLSAKFHKKVTNMQILAKVYNYCTTKQNKQYINLYHIPETDLYSILVFNIVHFNF